MTDIGLKLNRFHFIGATLNSAQLNMIGELAARLIITRLMAEVSVALDTVVTTCFS